MDSWIAAPPTFGASIIAAAVWYFGKWGAARIQGKWGKSRTSHGDESEEESPELIDSPVRREGTWRQETGPGVVPW